VSAVKFGDGFQRCRRDASAIMARRRFAILAFRNSEGDREMLEHATGGPGRTLALLVHHDDAGREFAYDRNSTPAKLDKAWDEAMARG
jgi:hypothetical protein